MVGLSKLKQNGFVWAALVVALTLRLVVVFTAYASAEPHTSDALYYILVAIEPVRLIARSDAAVKAIGPLYPLFLVPFFHLIPERAATTQLIAVRVAQALLDTVAVGLVYLLARAAFGERVGRLALVVQATDARYLFQAGAIATETLFIALFVAFMLSYTLAIQRADLGKYRWAGVLLGLAILTRPVPLLFPVALAVLAWLRPQARLWKGLVWMTVMMLVIVLPWIIRTLVVTGEPIPIATTAFSHLWLASREDGRELGGQSWEQAAVQEAGEEGVDTAIADLSGEEYVTTSVRNILAAPGQWIGRIVGDTVRAYLQPYGTHFLLDPSSTGVKDSLRDFLNGRTSLSQLLAIPGFGRRVLMYLWHFWGLAGGVVGAVWMGHDRRWNALPLVWWIAYGTLVSAPLLVEPRYLFPLMFAYTILAAYATVQGWDALWRHAVARQAPPQEHG